MLASRKLLHALIDQLSEKDIPQTESFLTGLLGIAPPAQVKPSKRKVVCCYCGSQHVIGNGTTRKGLQRFRCMDCKKSFTETTGAVNEYSHQSDGVWRSVIADAMAGIGVAYTAYTTGLSVTTIYSMRHKVLCGIETALSRMKITLEGINQADETIVLESHKGTKLPANYYRKPRKHSKTAGLVTQGNGTTDEHIVICTSVAENSSNVIATPVKRKAASGDDVLKVFADKVNDDTVIVCDGSAIYDCLSTHCVVSHSKRHINVVNSLHNYMKTGLNKAHGVATKYLNRYLSLYRQTFGKDTDTAINEILGIVKERDNRFVTIAELKTHNLLVI